MTKHAFPAFVFCEQKRYLGRHIVKPRSMKLHGFISRLKELNAYLEEFPPDIEGQETAPLPVDEIMDIIYHSMSTTWKNKSRYFGAQGSKKKKSSAAAKKTKDLKRLKKYNREDSDSSVGEAIEEFTMERRSSKKCSSLHEKYNLSTDKCNNLRSMINKHKQKLKENFKHYILCKA